MSAKESEPVDFLLFSWPIRFLFILMGKFPFRQGKRSGLIYPVSSKTLSVVTTVINILVIGLMITALVEICREEEESVSISKRVFMGIIKLWYISTMIISLSHLVTYKFISRWLEDLYDLYVDVTFIMSARERYHLKY